MRLLLALTAFVSFLGAWQSSVAAQLLGPEFQVSTNTLFAKYGPVVSSDGSGSFVVVWESPFQDGSGAGVYARRFNSAAAPVGSEFRVNGYTTNGQGRPAVAAAGQGEFLVVWQSNGPDGSYYGIFGRRYDAGGLPVGGDFLVNNYTTNGQYSPAVAVDGSGDFIVVWISEEQEGSPVGVFGQRLSSAGQPIGSEFQVVSLDASDLPSPAVAIGDTGNFVVVWSDEPEGIRGRRFDSSGVPVGGEFQVNTYTTYEQLAPAVAIDGSGSFGVFWHSYDQDGSGYGAFGQRFGSAGVPVGGEFRVNRYTTNHQVLPAVAMDAAGNFVVVWTGFGASGTDSDVFGKRYDSSGLPMGSEFRVSTYTTGHQSSPTIASDGLGRFIVAWEDRYADAVTDRRLTMPFFHGGFESGDVCDWSASMGGGTCP